MWNFVKTLEIIITLFKLLYTPPRHSALRAVCTRVSLLRGRMWLILIMSHGFQGILMQLQNKSSGRGPREPKPSPPSCTKQDQHQIQTRLLRVPPQSGLETLPGCGLYSLSGSLVCCWTHLGGFIMCVNVSLLQFMTLWHSPKSSPGFLHLSKLNNFWQAWRERAEKTYQRRLLVNTISTGGITKANGRRASRGWMTWAGGGRWGRTAFLLQLCNVGDNGRNLQYLNRTPRGKHEMKLVLLTTYRCGMQIMLQKSYPTAHFSST